MGEAGGAGNRRRDAGPGDQPGESDLGRGRAMLGRDFVEGRQDALTARVEIFRDAPAARALAEVLLGAVLAGQETTRQRESERV